MNFRSISPRLVLGIAVGAIALFVLMASTGPNPDQQLTSNFRRVGGPCLQLEQWGLFGWTIVGQTHTLSQVRNGDWQPPVDDPPCTDVADTQILVRMPFDAAFDEYRICGLQDDRGCIEFSLVPFLGEGGPGP